MLNHGDPVIYNWGDDKSYFCRKNNSMIKRTATYVNNAIFIKYVGAQSCRIGILRDGGMVVEKVVPITTIEKEELKCSQK